jgi:hypothetical protein
MTGTYVEPHEPSLGAVDPAAVAAAAITQTTAVQAAATIREHYHQHALGQGAVGDPMPAESTLQPVPPNSQPDLSKHGPVGSL